jgi:hypothetical protein
MALRGLVGAVDPVAVEQPGVGVGEVAVPDELGLFRQGDLVDLAFVIGTVE